MNTNAIGAALVLSVVGIARAQGVMVVPASATATDATGILAAPGIGIGYRIQVLVAGSELGSAIGRHLVGMKFRRDSSWTEALAAASGQFAIRIGNAAHGPDHAAPSFGANVPQSTEVFRGIVQAPASPADPQAPGWTATEAIDVSFTQAFTYQGGPLGIEIEVLSHPGAWWPIDAVEDPATGSHISTGGACGRHATFVHTADVRDAELVIGRTTTFHFIGEPTTPAWLLLGFGLLPTPMDLAPVGAPGCRLFIQPISSVPAFLSSAVPGLDHGGRAWVDVHITADTGLFGAPISAQFVGLSGASLSTSNGLLCSLASVPPTLPVVAIVSRAGEQPRVQSGGVPVLGLVWQ